MKLVCLSKMKLLYFVVLTLLLQGCATQSMNQILTNLDKDCARQYQGGISQMGATMTFNISCLPSGNVAPPVKPAPTP